MENKPLSPTYDPDPDSESSSASSGKLPEHIEIPDGIPKDFDPKDNRTWGETPQKQAPPPPPPPPEEYHEAWMYEDAQYDTGSGRFKPLFVLLAGVSIAILLPFVPTFSSASMLVFMLALIVWRVAVAFRDIEQTDRGNVNISNSPRFANLSRVEWAAYLLGLASSVLMYLYHGIGAFILVVWIVAFLIFWRIIRLWSWRIVFLGILVLSLSLWAMKNPGTGAM